VSDSQFTGGVMWGKSLREAAVASWPLASISISALRIRLEALNTFVLSKDEVTMIREFKLFHLFPTFQIQHTNACIPVFLAFGVPFRRGKLRETLSGLSWPIVD